jgi:hypothetical protein
MESQLKSAGVISTYFFVLGEFNENTMKNRRYNVPSLVTTGWTIWCFNPGRSKIFLFPKLPHRSGTHAGFFSTDTGSCLIGVKLQ